MIPPAPGDGAQLDLAEETRIVYVGATRARRQLLHAKGFKRLPARSFDESGRVYSPYPNAESIFAKVQIGVASDIDPVGLAGRACFAEVSSAREAQSSLLVMPKTAMLSAKWKKFGEENRYELCLPGIEQPIAYTSTALNRDLTAIGRGMFTGDKGEWLAPNPGCDSIHVFGVRTIVVPEGPLPDMLHDPWRHSRILLAPMILGFCNVGFTKRRSRA
jgi:hypothetical protein